MKVKIFKGARMEQLQDQINAWLTKNPTIKREDWKMCAATFANDTAGHSDGIVIAIWYTE